ncbi:epimerase [Psychromonas sp. CNPT3]|uniref:NAD(P)H-binding protein n=1 Tax=Psychromonas sp. CNPT3 TaxID=314282 RepID=UPI00006E83F1|nr:NAD(P)H-binding protein [Psychromonas sp. CNPT3]AGH81156.1 epimerase [Psychromonas sp. CNPT3]
MQKKISVLGSGWLGLPLAECLISRGYDVKGSTRSSARFDLLQQKGVPAFLLDISQEKYDADEFFNADILIVNIPYKGIEAFVTLTSAIQKANIKHVIFISATSVYANKEGMVSENDALVPCALVDIENLFTTNQSFDTTIIRFSGLLGYGRDPALFFTGDRCIKNPASSVNMIHRDDCIKIIYSVIESNAWGEIYNACSDTHPSRKLFYCAAAKTLAMPAPKFLEQTDNHDKVISNQKIKVDLNYRFLHPNLLGFKF